MDDLLQNALQAGYADAFKSLYEDEKKRRIDAELKLANTINFVELMKSQLLQARDERDKLQQILADHLS